MPIYQIKNDSFTKIRTKLESIKVNKSKKKEKNGKSDKMKHFDNYFSINSKKITNNISNLKIKLKTLLYPIIFIDLFVPMLSKSITIYTDYIPVGEQFDVYYYYYARFPDSMSLYGYAINLCSGNNCYQKSGNYLKIKSNNNYNKIILSYSYSFSNAKQMFENCTKIISIDFNNFNMNDIINVSHMFYYCISLQNITNFNPINTEDMSFLFYNCSSLTNIGYKSSFSNDKVKKMNSMFSGCENIKMLNLNKHETSKVTDMSFMFDRCGSLDSLNIDSLNTSKVKTMRAMFQKCEGLPSLNLASFETN